MEGHDVWKLEGSPTQREALLWINQYPGNGPLAFFHPTRFPLNLIL
jgi:hypothetical protein